MRMTPIFALSSGGRPVLSRLCSATGLWSYACQFDHLIMELHTRDLHGVQLPLPQQLMLYRDFIRAIFLGT